MSNELIYIERIPVAERPGFANRLTQVSAILKTQPNWLLQVFHAESGVNAQAVNKQTGASGLIQFMPATAKALGTTVEAIRKMTATQQLEWVLKYFAPYAGRLNSYFDVYLVVFFPAAIGKGDAWVMQTSRLSPEVIAKQNPAININKDGKITVAEFKQYLVNTVPKSLRELIFSPAAAAGGATLLLLLGFFF